MSTAEEGNPRIEGFCLLTRLGQKEEKKWDYIYTPLTEVSWDTINAYHIISTILMAILIVAIAWNIILFVYYAPADSF